MQGRLVLCLALLVIGASALSTGKLRRRMQDRCGGECLDVRTHQCKTGSFVSNLWDGGPNIQCCQPEPGVGVPCTGGVCQLTSTPCAGTWKSRLCPGGGNVKCCQSSATAGDSPAPSTPSGGGGSTSGGNARAIKLGASFASLWKEYPNGEADVVKHRIGGQIDASWITNTCTIRVTRAIVRSGVKVKPFTLANGKQMVLVPGADKIGLAIRVAEFKEYMTKNYGTPQVKVINPGDGTATVPSEFNGKKGIIYFRVRTWSDATGHFDLWDGTACAHECYFDKCKEAYLWVVD